VHVSIPDGLALVDGDTTYEVPVTKSAPARRIRLSPERNGTFIVRATLEIANYPGNSDFDEEVLPITVTDRTMRPGTAHTGRLECTRAGHRFRIAGLYLVPLDEGDVVDTHEFYHGGGRPRAVATPSAKCSRCALAAADTAYFTVVVDKLGNVVQAESIGKPDGTWPSPEAITAARAILSSWRFEPARVKGQPIYDWCNIAVPVTAH
jgi:hypothetical protein